MIIECEILTIKHIFKLFRLKVITP